MCEKYEKTIDSLLHILKRRFSYRYCRDDIVILALEMLMLADIKLTDTGFTLAFEYDKCRIAYTWNKDKVKP